MKKPPSYRLHKASGQAVVTVAGKDHYLGRWGTPESRLRYERLITGLLLPSSPSDSPEAAQDVTVVELCESYLRFATTHYQKDGVATSELNNVKRAIRCLRGMYGSLPAKEFSPLKLKACRDQLIKDGLCRTNVNRHCGIMVRIIGHGVENELVPGSTHHALKAVRPLQAGRSGARETEPVRPVSDEDVEATLAYLSDPYRTMVRVQGLIGCRPGELRSMTSELIDRSGEVWIYRPASHKTQHHGKERIIPIGPQAQNLLLSFLPCFPGMLLFKNRRGKQISRNSHEQAIHAACRKAGVEPWSPNQLRHSAATRIRKEFGLEAACVILGHSNVQTTQVYAERDLTAALKIAAKLG